MIYVSFVFNDTPTTEIYTYGHTLSLHDALPICRQRAPAGAGGAAAGARHLAAIPQQGRFARASRRAGRVARSEEHTSELQSLMRISYAVFCLKKKKQKI